MYGDDVAPPKLDDVSAPWRIRAHQMVVHFCAQDIALHFLYDRPEALAAQSAAVVVLQPHLYQISWHHSSYLVPVCGLPGARVLIHPLLGIDERVPAALCVVEGRGPLATKG